MENRAAYMRAYRARQKPRNERACGFCGERWVPDQGHAQYCSDACRAAAWRERRTVTVTYEAEGFPIPANTYDLEARERAGYYGCVAGLHSDAGVCRGLAVYCVATTRNARRRHLRCLLLRGACAGCN
jgi:hypothetical protein